MDLSLTIADSFEVISGQFFDVDSVYVKNSRKYIRFDGPLYATFTEKFTMIEGVGTNAGIADDYWGNYSTYLLCSYKDNNIEYQNDSPIYNGQCTSFSTGIEENIKVNKQQLLKIVDVLGRESMPQPNVPLFYIYRDGTVEKRIVVE